jgi:hypothetical protein
MHGSSRDELAVIGLRGAMTIDSVSFIKSLVTAREQSGDPAATVFEHYLRWKGPPQHLVRQPPPADVPPEALLVSPWFSVLAYRQNPLYQTYCTLGASYRSIPHSAASTGDARGIRHEYIMHAPEHHEAAICELLLLVSEYPQLHEREIGVGFVVPIGEPVVVGSGMEYLYCSLPFLDDQRLYQADAFSRIDRPEGLIQLVWLVPIYRSEYQHLRTIGSIAFEEWLFEHHRQRYDAYEFDRLPLI